MRFIFGAAEAGFFPGIMLFLTYWFTAHERARWVGVFMVAIRRKLEPDPSHPRYFITEPGAGIRFVPEGVDQPVGEADG